MTFSLSLALIGVDILLILHRQYGPQPASDLGFTFLIFPWIVFINSLPVGLLELATARTVWKHQLEANQPLIVLT
jgi:hypothetical protein